MLLLAILAAVSTPQAHASVLIVQAVRVTKADWDKLPAQRRREVTIREKDGRLLKVRLVEFE